MRICHVHCKFRVVDIQLIVFVTDKAPTQFLAGSISLKCVELIFDLIVDILILAFAFSLCMITPVLAFTPAGIDPQ